MPDWSAIKRKAYTLHKQFNSASFADGDNELLSAEKLIQDAIESTGLSLLILKPTDPLLSGAFALLDREMSYILCRESEHQNDRRANFAIAHELAHFWLHPEVQTDICTDSEMEMLDSQEEINFGSVEIGYSPEERREKEANIFAAEFLLPSKMLAKVFLEDRWSSQEIAAKIGISKIFVLNQLSNAVLLPTDTSDGTSDHDIASPEIMEPLELIKNLDESQHLAACIEKGPVLVDAGPGTGKTRTLIARIVHLVLEKGVPPERILALTYSNKASEEMRTRLQKSMGDSANLVWIGTFHAFGLEILRKYSGQDFAPSLLDKADAVSLLVKNLNRLSLHHYEYLNMPAIPFPSLISCFQRAKDELKTPLDYLDAAEKMLSTATNAVEKTTAEKALEAAQVFEVYEELLADGSRLDYGDLLNRAITLIDEDDAVRLRLQNQYPYILADEYQDINRASAKLLQRLAGDGSGFWAVGDLRQAIYRFRGASPANVEQFETDFPGGFRLNLGVNYRSKPPLVSLFNAMAKDMRSSSEINLHEGKSWVPFRDDDGYQSLYALEADSEIHQAKWIASGIREQEKIGVSLNEQAVLCRTNAQASELADRLAREGIPTLHTGSILQIDEIKDLLALLSLVMDGDSSALLRVGQFPEYSISQLDMQTLISTASENHEDIIEAMKRSDEMINISDTSRPGISILSKHLEQLCLKTNPARILLDYLFTLSAYLRTLFPFNSHEKKQKTVAIHQLITAAQKYTSSRKQDTDPVDTSFLSYIRMLKLCGDERSLGAVSINEGSEAVRVMTVHSSKGLEFHTVFVPNLNENQFPVRKQGSMSTVPAGLLTEDSLPELESEAANESRLFFVALTRAKDMLFISRSKHRNGKAVKPSSLLQEIRTYLNRSNSWANTSSFQDSEILSTFVETEYTQSVSQHVVRNSFTESELRTYIDCPRRYYYQHFLSLSDSGRKSTYYIFSGSLMRSMEWMKQRIQLGEAPALEQLTQYFMDDWQTLNLDSASQHSELLRKRGIEMLCHYWTEYSESGALSQQDSIEVRKEGARISFHAEKLETLPNGTTRVTRFIKTRPKPDDKNDIRLALVREGLKQKFPDASVDIQIKYISDGSRISVPPSPAYEPNRVKKYFDAIENIKLGNFDPSPSDLKCCQCPFYFICTV